MSGASYSALISGMSIGYSVHSNTVLLHETSLANQSRKEVKKKINGAKYAITTSSKDFLFY